MIGKTNEITNYKASCIYISMLIISKTNRLSIKGFFYFWIMINFVSPKATVEELTTEAQRYRKTIGSY